MTHERYRAASRARPQGRRRRPTDRGPDLRVRTPVHPRVRAPRHRQGVPDQTPRRWTRSPSRWSARVSSPSCARCARTIIRSSFSSVIYEFDDFSCALFGPGGEMVAQSWDHPGHVLPLPWGVRCMFEDFAGDLHPGDVVLLNDPYRGGTHLNDVDPGPSRLRRGRQHPHLPRGTRPLGGCRRHGAGELLRPSRPTSTRRGCGSRRSRSWSGGRSTAPR